MERANGAFRQAFLLPALINADNAVAAFKDGVLEIMLPKAEGAKPKAIKVAA